MGKVKDKKRRAKRKDTKSKVSSLGLFPSNRIKQYLLYNETRKTLLCVAVLFLLDLIFFSINGFIFSDKMILGSDFFPTGYSTYKNYADFFRQHFAAPQWDPYILGGMPGLETGHIQVFDLLGYLRLVMPIHRAEGWKALIFFFISGTGMFLYLKQISINRWVALLGGACYMFAPLNASLAYAGHSTKLVTAAILPYSLLFMEKGLKSRSWIYFVFLSITIGANMLMGHFQLLFFGMWLLGFYFIFRLYQIFRLNRDKKQIARLVVLFSLATVLGVTLGAGYLYPPYEYSKLASPRTGGVEYNYAASWSLHPEEIVSLIVPEFVHHLEFYWGQNVFKYNSEYSGIIFILFSLFALFFLRNKTILFFTAGGCFALIFSLGAHTPIHKLFYLYVPFVKLLRAPSLITFIFAFSVITVGAIGCNYFFKDGQNTKSEQNQKIMKVIKYFIISFGVLTLVISLNADKFFDAWKNIFFSGISAQKWQIIQNNIPQFIKGLWIAFVISATTGVLVIARLKDKIQIQQFFLVLLLMVLIDCWRIDLQFYKLVDVGDYVKEDSAIRELERDNEIFRVFPLPGTYPSNFLSIFGVESVTGFHNNELSWYREFRQQDNSNLIYRLQKNSIHDNPFLNLLNVKYLIYREPESNRNVLIRNEGYLSRIFLANNYIVLPEEDVIDRLKSKDFDYKHTVILTEEPVDVMHGDSSSALGKVKIEEYDGQHYVISAQLDNSGFLIISNNYFPEWKAYDNGRKMKLYRANYTQMALQLDKGIHNIELKYDSKYVRMGFYSTIISLLIAMVLISLYYWKARRRILLKKSE